MTTFVGTQEEFSEALKELVELEYDAVEAYDAAINRLENKDYRSKLADFKEDHKRHIQVFTELLIKFDESAPTGPSTAKQWLTKGKVVIANLLGDGAILSAMASNEADTNTAYERMYKREDKWEESKELIERGLEDERRHKAWLENITL